MSLNEELATWVAARPDCHKDAVARFRRNETLTTEDIATIVDQLIAGTYPTASNITPADVPGSTAEGDPVTLSQVAEVAGVNALLAGQTLSFGASGLTIIFGNNASGKSGYARSVREAVTARVKSDRLLGDVFAERESAQTATLDYCVRASPGDGIWAIRKALTCPKLGSRTNTAATRMSQRRRRRPTGRQRLGFSTSCRAPARQWLRS